MEVWPRPRMSTMPKRIWKTMVRPAEMKYMVRRPKLLMYLTAIRVERNLGTADTQTPRWPT